MALPTISVVIPVRNSVNTIEKAIQSILSQNYPQLQLIILDAGSTDGTVEVIKRYEQAIYYWHSKPDSGAYLAINAGVEIATGDIIAQLMADDWFEPGIFAAIGAAAEAHPQVDIFSCGGRFMLFDAATQEYKTTESYVTEDVLQLDFQHICFAIPAMSSRFVRKKLIDKIALFKPIGADGKPIFSADREFLLRAVHAGAKNYIVPQLGHTYFAHAGSATFGKNRVTQLKIYQEHMNIADNYLQKTDLTVEQRRVLQHWYNDQAVRLLIFKVWAGDVGSVFGIFKNALKQTQVGWLIALLSVPSRIIAKKINSYFSL